MILPDGISRALSHDFAVHGFVKTPDRPAYSKVDPEGVARLSAEKVGKKVDEGGGIL